MFLVANCASKPVPSDLSQFAAGHFEVKALVRDLKANKSQVVNLNVNAIRPDKLRVDATSALGTHVFSLVNDGNQVEYIVVSEKKHYTGKSSPLALKPVLAMPISPAHFMNIFFEKPIEDKGWACTKADDGTLQSCKQLRSKTEVQWSTQKDGKRLIEITVPSVARIQMNVRGFDDDVDVKKHPFALNVPKSFKTVRIQ